MSVDVCCKVQFFYEEQRGKIRERCVHEQVVSPLYFVICSRPTPQLRNLHKGLFTFFNSQIFGLCVYNIHLICNQNSMKIDSKASI